MSIVLLLLTLLQSHANLTGTWALDRVRSDFGGAASPTHYVLVIDQVGTDLAVTTFSEDVTGRRVTYRQFHADDEMTGLLRPVTPDGQDEIWRVNGDSLTITRFAGRSHQKLVLERSTPLE